MTADEKLEILLRGHPVIVNHGGTQVILQVTPATKKGPGKYRLHYAGTTTQASWNSEVKSKDSIRNMISGLPFLDYFDLPKKKLGKHKCRCDIMLLMAKGCQCNGV